MMMVDENVRERESGWETNDFSTPGDLCMPDLGNTDGMGQK